MQLAFVLYKYFPFGGLQRDFMRIALECQKRGHQIRVYTMISVSYTHLTLPTIYSV